MIVELNGSKGSIYSYITEKQLLLLLGIAFGPDLDL